MVFTLICGSLKNLLYICPSVKACQTNMTTPNRFFVNPYDDYKGGDVVVKKDVLRDRLRNILQNIVDNQSRKLSDCDGGLYVGLSGIAYTFYYLSTLPAFIDKKQEYLKIASEYISIAMQYTQTQSSDTRSDPKTTVGFLLGNIGVHTVGALIKSAQGNHEQFRNLIKLIAKAADTCGPINFLKHGSDEMFVGRAGYLNSLLILKKRLGVEAIGMEQANALCTATMCSNRKKPSDISRKQWSDFVELQKKRKLAKMVVANISSYELDDKKHEKDGGYIIEVNQTTRTWRISSNSGATIFVCSITGREIITCLNIEQKLVIQGYWKMTITFYELESLHHFKEAFRVVSDAVIQESDSSYSSGDVVVKKDVLRDRLRNILQNIVDNQSRKLSDCDGGLYVGLSGIAYTFYYLSTLPAFIDKKQEYLKIASEYISIAMQYTQTQSSDTRSDPKTTVGFLLGNIGVHTVGALIKSAQGNHEQFRNLIKLIAKAADTCGPINFLKHGSDEMFVGRAGYLNSLLILKKRLGVEAIGMEQANALCTAAANSGREYSKHYHSQSPLMYAYYDTEYLGAAHGLSAILQVLLSFTEFLKENADAEKDIKGGVDFLLSLQQPNGNFPCAMDEVRRKRPESDELVHWCHGAPGICHGIAGNGYVFLILYRLTNEKKHLYRAQRFADFMFTDDFKRHARTPDYPYSLHEGLAGTACYLADLFQPENAEFPLFD
uniref:LanC-like protein 3 homolog n=1 Tax=Strigamia maritima TaxID=126957 RepID=T1JC93_STRMM